MSEETQARPLKATLKAGSSYDAPWLTVEAHDASELNDTLAALAQLDSFQAVVDAANTLKAVNVVSAPDEPAPAPAPAAQGATVTQHPASTGLKTCAHGVRQRKTGTNSRGEWVGYFCPQPKNASDKCEPIWGN